MADAFFLPTDEPDTYLATGHTQGPWGADQQHAGPPSALLTRAAERLPTSLAGPGLVARLTVEILSAVPIGELRVAAHVARPGRSVELIEAELSAEGRTVLRARLWRVRAAELALPAGAVSVLAPPPMPSDEEVWPGRPGYLSALEWRFAEGHFEQLGPALVWARPRVSLVAGEEMTPLQRTITVADSGNGVSRMLDMEEWWFINTELTVHLHRAPTGQWTAMRAVSTLDPSGIGLASTELYDEAGRVGRGAQALLVGPRPPG